MLATCQTSREDLARRGNTTTTMVARDASTKLHVHPRLTQQFRVKHQHPDAADECHAPSRWRGGVSRRPIISELLRCTRRRAMQRQSLPRFGVVPRTDGAN
jgi:hypothetical protein